MNWRPGKNGAVIFGTTTVVAVMIGLVSYSPTLYQLFCAATGYGGTVQRANAATVPAKMIDRSVTVRFDANVAAGLDWDFAPEQSGWRSP